MFAFLLATVLCVAPGDTLRTEVDVPMVMITPGTFHAEDLDVAQATGDVAVHSSRGSLNVTGVDYGTTRLLVSFFSGMSVHRIPVGTIIVDDPLSVAITAPQTIAENTPLTLTATSTGATSIFWYDRELYLGAGNAITVTLARGSHRITAEARNDCGSVNSNEVRIEVVPRRRRAARS